MSNNNAEWPIAPTFLSLRQGCTEDTANYNTDGIYYTDYLRGFLADLSHDPNIQNALSLFQFVPKDFLPHDPNAENPNEITKDPTKATVILNEPVYPKIAEILERQGKKIIRIDSGTYVNNGRLCDAFRKCYFKHTSFCFKQDSIVGIFADEKLNELRPNTDQYRQSLEEIVAEFNQNRAEIIKCDAFIEGGKIRRLYVHYTCPCSLFEEHIFPIYAQGRIIACLMFGQVARDAFDKKKAFRNFENIMQMYIDFYDEIVNVKTIDNELWSEKVDTIINRIEIFEKRLEDRIDYKNTRYINSSFDSIEKHFRKEVKGINIKKQYAVSEFSCALNRAFDSIKEKFEHSEDGFIRMFALPIDIHHNKLVPIGWSGAEFDKIDDYSFSLSLLKDIDKTLLYSYQKDRILNSASIKIREKFDAKEGDIFLPGWLAGSEVAYIVWKRHDNELRRKRKAFETYKYALLDFYSVALECYSYIRGARMELLLETTIQESAHESAHFILPAIDVVENNMEPISKDFVSLKYIERYFKDKDSFENYKDDVLNNLFEKYKKYKDSFDKYKAEVLESLDQLREINYGSSLIFSSHLQINKKPVEVFEILYKLKKTLITRASDSHKNIFYKQKENYVKANIDAKYFNHALYNLLDNAIKYGYEGSNVRINMNVDRKKGILIIDVVSYGIKIEEGDRIYKIFERSEEATRINRGTGLGLYIVKKVCEAHGGTINHTSQFLCNYNIPILFNYKYRNLLAQKNSLNEIMYFNHEIARLSGSIEHEVVCNTHFVKYAIVFSSSIYTPTYRNTFCVQIPLN